MSPSLPLRRSRAQRGFTLVEMLAIVGIVAVLTAAVSPSMIEASATSRLDAAANQLAGAVRLARAEAVKRGTVVLVEPISASAWAGGLRVLADDDGNPTTVPPSNPDPTVRVFDGVRNVSTETGAPARLAFDGRGQNVSLAADPQPTTSIIALCASGKRRSLRFEPSGALLHGTPAGGC